MSAKAKPAPGPLSEEITKILRGQRARLKASQQQTADAAGEHISREQLSVILRDERNIDINQLDWLCWALGLNIVDVVKEASDAVRNRQSEPGWPARRL